MRGKSLEYILNGVRAEARLSLLPAHNTQVRDSQIKLIQREQERLWEDFAWPHLRIRHLMPLQAGQRLYETPTTADYTIQMDRIEKIEVRDGGEWRPLGTQITGEHLSAHDSDLDERSWPARAWRATADDDIEIWPIPDQNADADTLEGYLKITGIRNLQPFTTDNHRADLDDRLISLYVAGGILAATGAKVVHEDVCVGCKVCTIACPFGTVNYVADSGKVQKCDLCGGDPACASACPTGAITYVDADWTGLDKMRQWAGKTDTQPRVSA